MTDLLEHKPAAERAPVLPGADNAAGPDAPSDVTVRALAKRFGDTAIFQDVSFDVRRGETTALVGANGTGKSTLLRCLLGLIPATDGQISVLDTPVTGANRATLRSLRARTGLVSQKHNLVPRLSVLTNVIHGKLGQSFGPRFWSQTFAPQDTRDAAMEALGKVGLAHLAERRADRLSGGQSQRVAISRALIGRPRLLIADEPCASLDPAAGEEVMELFFRLVRDEGVTVVFTSHNIDHALRYGDRVLGLANHRLELDTDAAALDPKVLRDLYD